MLFQSLRRGVRAYAAIAAMFPKQFAAYTLWVWAEMVVQLLSMLVFAYFWRAIYASTAATTLGGLALGQTLNYILLARLLAPLVETNLIFQFGYMIRQGQVAVELLRPVDMQARFYVEAVVNMGLFLALRVPLVVVAVLFFGLQLPTDPAQWLAFGLTLWLGQAILFLFDWIFACLAFYSTETWGLSMVRVGLAMFFSGALIPIQLMPAGLQAAAQAMPFAQALGVPASFLSGATAASALPDVLLVQVVWLVGLGVVSRLVYGHALRTLTVQGG